MTAGKQLLILRHAKSSWEDPNLSDHDRPLAPRGRRATQALAAYLRQVGVAPELVLCSSARRAVQTLEGVGPGGQWLIEPDLYGAGADDLVGRLRRVEAGVSSVMMIGHNPAMQMLVLTLTAAGGPVADKFPTGGLARLALGCAWGEVGPGSAQLVDFVRPRDLE